MSMTDAQGSGYSSPQTIARYGGFEVRHAVEGVEITAREPSRRGARLTTGAALAAAGGAILSGVFAADRGLGMFLTLAGGIVALSGLLRGGGGQRIAISGSELIVGQSRSHEATRRPLSAVARVTVQTMSRPRRRGRSMRNIQFFRVALEDGDGRRIGPVFQPLLREAAKGLAEELSRRIGVGIADDFERTSA